VTCPCGWPAGDHALILYSGGPGALFPPDASQAAEKARRRTPPVRDAPDPAEPPTAVSAGAAPVRRRTKKQQTEVAAWRKLAERKGKP
jgi:hypothetical protein